MLNVRFGRRLFFSPPNEVAGGRGLLVWDHDLGVGQIDPHPIRVVTEDLDPKPVGPQDGGDQVGVDALAPEDDGPALHAHWFIVLWTPPPALRAPSPASGEAYYQPNEGSTMAACNPRIPAE